MGASKKEDASEKPDIRELPEALRGVAPRTWQQARSVSRVKAQYDPAEVARRSLDDMEAGDRLHYQRRRDRDEG